MSFDRKISLLFVIDSLTGGGAERILSQLANWLDPERFSIHIVLSLGNECLQQLSGHVRVTCLADWLPKRSYPGFRTRLDRQYARLIPFIWPDDKPGPSDIGQEITNFMNASWKLGDLMAVTQPDCVLSFLPNSNLITLFASKLYHLKLPVLCSDRNHLSSELTRLPWPNLRRHLVRRHYPNAARHIAVTAAAGADLRDNFGIADSNIETIHNGVDLVRIRSLAASPLPSGELLSPDVMRIVSVGRLNHQKGLDTLLTSLARLTCANWELLLIGQGEEETRLREMASGSGILGRVRFLGWQSNPYSWLASSDIFVLSSRWEGMPNVMLEAMALGLPVISTDCPTGPREILDHGRFGTLVPTENPEALRAAIDNLVQNPDLRDRYSTLSANRSESFSLQAMVDRYCDLITCQALRT